MLSLLASATSAAARPAAALQPAPPSRSCLSTAVDIRTVECNLDCNMEGVTCPAACVCSETGSSSAELALSMPSSDFMRLSDFVGTLEVPSDFAGPFGDDPQVPVTSLVRRSQANNMTAPATSDPEAALKRLPSDAVGFYMKTWSCLGNPPRPQELHTFPCVGPEHKAVNVVFSGYATLERALAAATPAAGDACKPSDKTYCDAQVASMVPWQVPTKKEAIAQMTAPGSVWAATCKTCLDPPKQDASMKEAMKHPYSRSHGHPDLNHGLQFLSLGGANGGGLLNVDRFKDFERDLPKVKAAGFQGLCFDIEMTKGETELVREIEKVFAMCKAHGLLVMVTTSHSAPYAAASEASKLAFVESWVRSEHIDIFSPQLYSRGREAEPELMETPCTGSDNLVSPHCSYQYLKKGKYIWMPSLATSSHYEAAKKYFTGEGIHLAGYIQWNRGHGDHDPK